MALGALAIPAQAAVMVVGTEIGIDLGTTSATTTNWANFSATGTIGAGSVTDTSGTEVDGVSIAFSQTFDNVPDAGNGGGRTTWSASPALPAVPVTAFGDFVWASGSGATHTLVLSGLDASLFYDIVVINQTIGADSTKEDMVTITGAGLPSSNTIVRTDANGGQYHSFTAVAPTLAGLITIDSTHEEGTNPVLNAVLITAIPEPSAFALLAGLGALGLLARRRRR